MSDTGPQVLLVQGGGQRRRKLLSMLDELGCTVVVDDGTDAALRGQTIEHVDVVLLDTALASADAHELLVELSANSLHIPIIVVCKRELMSDALDALRHGACDYIKLPVEDSSVLEHALRRALQQTLLQRENLAYRHKLEDTNRELLDSLTLLRQDQKAGRHIQMSMLPDTPMQIDELVFDHRVVPSLYLSGDFVDYFRVGDHHAAFFMADVSGHGASSAFVTVMLKNLFARKRSRFNREGLRDIFSPAVMLKCANDDLLDMHTGKHATMVVGIIDCRSGEGMLGVAGHLPAPAYAEHGAAEYIQAEGVAVGLFEDAEYTEQPFSIGESGVFTVCSDGILEVLPGDGLLDREALLLDRLQPGYRRIEALRAALGLSDLGVGPDDIAVLIVSRGESL